MKAHYLGAVFILAVIAPSVVLATLVVRSISNEEAIVEKRLETTLLAEVTHAAGLINAEIDRIREELGSGINIAEGENLDQRFGQWKKRSALVEVPFLLSARFEILWPRLSDALDESQLRFLDANGLFLSNRLAVPVYRNIAILYQDEINRLVEESRILETTGAGADSRAEAPAESEAVPAQEAISGGGAMTQQQALDTFEQSAPVRKKVYEQAREKGEQLNVRTVQPVAQAVKSSAAVTEQQSVLVTQPESFNQITATGEYGIIPRFIDERLTLIFWKRLGDGRFAGCSVNDAVFRDRIASVLSGTYSGARIMTILDENGKPLLAPHETSSRNWRQPFVAREIGETLPRWEVASYLARPDEISSRARVTSLLLWILVTILVVSVAGGGALVLTSVYSEIRLAQRKATFVTNVSHELKTPLTSIRLFAELLRQDRQPDAAKRDQYLSIMASETERLTRLINNVLDFSAMAKGKKRYAKQALDIVPLCRETFESQRCRLEQRGFGLRFVGSAGAARVCADGEAIKQAVVNLLSNAEKYSPSVKEIEMEVGGDGDTVLISIRDRGIGIAARHRRKIFREFYRVDDSLTTAVQGSGLGLTIARRIVQEHGGDIAYIPRAGGGSEFQIRLPLEEDG